MKRTITINGPAEVLFGNVWLDPDGPANPDNQQAIVESFGEDYQRLLDAWGDHLIPFDGPVTNDRFRAACTKWVEDNPVPKLPTEMGIRITRITAAALYSDVTICLENADDDTEGYEDHLVSHTLGASAAQRAHDIERAIYTMAAEGSGQ